MVSALILLPLAALAVVLGVAVRRTARAGHEAPRRLGLLAALVFLGSYVLFVSELLSLFERLDLPSVIVAWAVVMVVGCLLALSLRSTPRLPGSSWPRDIEGRVYTGIVAVVLLVTALTASLSPPNTWDSMTYHMSRVAHWVQNRTLAYYPTHILRQNLMPPAAEVGMLHLQLLSGGDRFANFIQWGAFAGCLAGVSLLAQSLGLPGRGQLLAAVVAATLPMAIVQSSGTKNDVVLSLWIVCLAYGVLSWRARATVGWSVWIGACLGLALATKVSAYIYCLPLVMVFLVVAWREYRIGAWPLLAVVFLVSSSLNAGVWFRHAGLLVESVRSSVALSRSEKPTDGSVVRALRRGMVDNERYLNARMTPALLAGVIVRNAGLHLTAPSKEASSALADGVRALLGTMGVDDPDPNTTYPHGYRFRSPSWSTHEDNVPNPLHFILSCGAFAAAMLLRRSDTRTTLLLCLTAVAGAFLFCAVLRWQPWHSRLHLPLFMLAAAPSAAILWRASWARLPTAILLFAASLPVLLTSASRPVLGENSILTTPRRQQYFANRPELLKDYVRVSQELGRTGCGRVGLVMHGNDWEYPLWALDAAHRRLSFRHIAVENPSRIAASEADRDFQPCAIVVVGRESSESFHYRRFRFSRSWAGSDLDLFLAKP